MKNYKESNAFIYVKPQINLVILKEVDICTTSGEDYDNMGKCIEFNDDFFKVGR